MQFEDPAGFEDLSTQLYKKHLIRRELRRLGVRFVKAPRGRLFVTGNADRLSSSQWRQLRRHAGELFDLISNPAA
jgi:hypothetical protein